MPQRRNVPAGSERVDSVHKLASLPAEVSSEFAAQFPLVKRIAYFMDDLIRLPGTQFRFGIDPILGFLPGIGDSLVGVVSIGAILASSHQKLPAIILFRMLLNVLLNTTLGAIPFLGDLFSFWFKSNVRNYRLLVRYAGWKGPVEPRHYLIVLGLLAVVTLSVVMALLFLSFLLAALKNFFAAKGS